MLDINTNKGTFSDWKSVFHFMREENLSDITVESIYYCLQPIDSKSYTYSIAQIEDMALNDFFKDMRK